MKFAACITTMNRIQELNLCLQALWNSEVKPDIVIVSDNSPEFEVQQQNHQTVAHYPDTVYLDGSHTGLSSNRNKAFSGVPPEIDLVSFLADDIMVEPDFIKQAIDRYTALSETQRQHIILSGDCKSQYHPQGRGPFGMSFMGYFRPADPPQVVCLAATVFPRSLLDQEKWDENIFLGQEDAEFSFRAVGLGYQILYCPELRSFDLCPHASTLPIGKTGTLTDYELYSHASRLYVGIKRHLYLSPNLLKLFTFIPLFFLHFTLYLLKRNSLHSWPEIIRRSKIQKLFFRSTTDFSKRASSSWNVSKSHKFGKV